MPGMQKRTQQIAEKVPRAHLAELHLPKAEGEHELYLTTAHASVAYFCIHHILFLKLGTEKLRVPVFNY